MTLVVGYAPDERGKAALHLAGMLARSADARVVVCSVVPAAWFPSMARVDAEYQQSMRSDAEAALQQARSAMPEDVAADYSVRHARSGPAGVLDVVAEHDGSMIVLGSSSAGVFGHIAVGSVTDRLLHSSPVPVALAPRGYRCPSGQRVRQVTVAYGGDEGVDALVTAAGAVAAELGAVLRLATFGVWQRPAYTTRLGTEPEDAVMDQWVKEMDVAVQSALQRLGGSGPAPSAVESVVGTGGSWGEALDDVEWDDGDVLVLGSSRVGPVSRVFIGSRSSKIVRHSPVPVVVVPREAAEGRAPADDRAADEAR